MRESPHPGRKPRIEAFQHHGRQITAGKANVNVAAPAIASNAVSSTVSTLRSSRPEATGRAPHTASPASAASRRNGMHDLSNRDDGRIPTRRRVNS